MWQQRLASGQWASRHGLRARDPGKGKGRQNEDPLSSRPAATTNHDRNHNHEHIHNRNNDPYHCHYHYHGTMATPIASGARLRSGSVPSLARPLLGPWWPRAGVALFGPCGPRAGVALPAMAAFDWPLAVSDVVGHAAADTFPSSSGGSGKKG